MSDYQRSSSGRWIGYDIHLGAEGAVRITQLIQFMSMFILVLAHFLIFRLVCIEHERCSTISPDPRYS